MAQSTPAQLKAKKNRLFADQNFFKTEEADFRDIFEDLIDSFASKGAANVPDYEAGTNYPAGYLVLYSLDPGGAKEFFTARLAGYLPAPTDAVQDDNWLATLGPVADNALFQWATVPALRRVRGGWMPGRLYILTGRTDPATGAALDDVYVRAISPVALEPEGFTLDNSSLAAEPVPVRYDLDIDTTEPVSSAVDAYTRAETDALLEALTLTARPVTYNQLMQLADTGRLALGNYYQVTDFQLTHTIAGTSTRYTSPVEQLLLFASSPRTLRPEGYSLSYPGDVIYYRRDNDQARMPGCTKGFIFRRHDTVQNNDLEIDFRNVRFRRWRVEFAAPDNDGNTGAFLATQDNGAAYADVPMFGEYARVSNNTWAHFDFRFRPSIFDNVNFTAEYRVLNTTLTSAVLAGVAFGPGTWLLNATLLNSRLEAVMSMKNGRGDRSFTLLNAVLTNRGFSDFDTGATLIASTIGAGQAIQNKTIVGGQDMSAIVGGPGGGPAVDAYTKTETDQKNAALQQQLDELVNSGGPVIQTFVFEPGYADSYTFTAGPDVAGTYTSAVLNNVAVVDYYRDEAITGLPLVINVGSVVRININRQQSTQVASVRLSK